MRLQADRTSHLIRTGVVIYIFALLLIAACSIAFHFLADSIVHRQETTARIVNVSGRQRMLSQRIAELALERATHADLRSDDETRSALRDQIDLMESAQRSLVQGSAETGGSVLSDPGVAEVYLKRPWRLQEQVKSFLTEARAVQAKSAAELNLQDSDLRKLEQEARSPLLNALDAAVGAIQQSSEASVAHLRRVLAWLTLTLLTILALEALLLYRPLFTRLKAANEELILTGRTDALTGCLNRRAFADEAERAVLTARAENLSLSVLMIDIDRFKSINDLHGHHAGDVAIRAVATILKTQTRSTDVVCRMGGDEFSVLLQGSPLQGAATAAQNLGRSVEQTAVEIGRGRHATRIFVTISVGAATLRENDGSLLHALKRADDALYRAKSAGRNRLALETDGAVLPMRESGERRVRA